MAKKTAKKTSKKTAAKKGDGSPQIIVAKGGLSASQFLKEVNFTLDEPLKAGQLRDLQNSLEAVVEKELGKGRPVNLYGLVKIVPRLHTKGERMVNKEFGNPESPKVKKTYKAKVSLKATQGIFSKKIKDAMPSVQKLQKTIGS